MSKLTGSSCQDGNNNNNTNINTNHNDCASSNPDDSLLLISWNIAGWASTKGLIQRHYGSVDAYLQRLGNPAILCLQETKVQEKDMKNEVAAKSLAALLENYRSYWSFNLASNRDGKGVATWVRKDIPVVGATQNVLGIPEFDDQGRLLATDHGEFVIVNVYAPFVGGGGTQEVEAKLRFMEALEASLRSFKDAGKRVFLCGDLNLTHRLQDQQFLRRVVRFDEDGMLRANGREVGPFEDWVNKWVPLKEVSVRTELPPDSLAAEAECVHIRESGCVPWLRKLVQPASESDWADVFAEVHPIAEDRFTSWSQTANLRYINLGTRIDYVICDRTTFQDCVIPSAAELLAGSRPGEDSSLSSTLTAAAALNAATSFGGWHASALFGIARGEGLGLQVDDMRLNDSQFPSRPHTGLIYTPPAYSDHIAVSVLLKKSSMLLHDKAKNSQTLSEASTKKSQPWTAQRGISSFFGGLGRGGGSFGAQAVKKAVDVVIGATPAAIAGAGAVEEAAKLLPSAAADAEVSKLTATAKTEAPEPSVAATAVPTVASELACTSSSSSSELASTAKPPSSSSSSSELASASSCSSFSSSLEDLSFESTVEPPSAKLLQQAPDHPKEEKKETIVAVTTATTTETTHAKAASTKKTNTKKAETTKTAATIATTIKTTKTTTTKKAESTTSTTKAATARAAAKAAATKAAPAPVAKTAKTAKTAKSQSLAQATPLAAPTNNSLEKTPESRGSKAAQAMQSLFFRKKNDGQSQNGADKEKGMEDEKEKQKETPEGKPVKQKAAQRSKKAAGANEQATKRRKTL
mmetsp:Transcript_98045/g.204501  ORF Transcript_98045/g.204501 Transcript_98045/m.204501 type:complete len:807 (+) Transcript_98045:102-2522(+)|eukprot:CAMPEP_0206511044 /NCGR_PEP_ID=MMETSP0324_2-20121206/60060_1 /ASSEMBLY_ACC=CAM_ASM_000836 /TAXON_ID=2866 /ORGANISM="Crypthecodinium cohnii, Strain Seligo" /LENGTH=806 /DNA_ID=CAMNT_0054002757 /DNA_START=61 /DNA_END=2481 /DNA_ORIENTATION=-